MGKLYFVGFFFRVLSGPRNPQKIRPSLLIMISQYMVITFLYCICVLGVSILHLSTILKFWILEHLELFDSVIFFAFHFIVDLNLPLLCYQAPFHIQLRSRVGGGFLSIIPVNIMFCLPNSEN
jgi:hypothetical protein